MRKIRIIALSILGLAVLSGCATTNSNREPQQIVGYVQAKNVEQESSKTFYNKTGKAFTECWITESDEDGGSRFMSDYTRNMAVFTLIGTDKFTGKNLTIEKHSFKYLGDQHKKYGRKSQRVVKSLIEEAYDKCDSLKEGLINSN